jgi:hypothetical protein
MKRRHAALHQRVVEAAARSDTWRLSAKCFVAPQDFSQLIGPG